MKYESLLIENENIDVVETSSLPHFQSGLYYEGTIYIKENMSVYKKHETLAEEIAHHKITYGNILDQSKILNRKFENKARRKAYESVISIQGIIDAYEHGVHNLHEMSLFFEVTEDFVQECIKHYKNKYGLQVKYGDYLIRFEPLTIFKEF
ncbi:ImmA/IrrE family metallo-endopeptidase [Staphylococcus hyicus]|uniref:ImmA/IrrE family metallo-endopeptidase n=1 Tax=Staphylococcus hyicus TaxID=1284 RepID=A0ACD5FL31_STAHY|nr:ImmA/IrrE family metallo-endopeptidase [Staphylococcus hyicus]MDP4447472.1 ImmA/IrrE family metallo-endopeptidase [Staphylococcus hyicus]MDP4460385.1 ImmA/IrrE family metallo-endopeptidase [Staphylococcus hyicus]MDP4464453.1 ImmA/IrrE family metallo-endopeptidase [Staphylococcus hyicus]